MFFFEKKNQKTFDRSGTGGAGVSDRREGGGIKVFWFFFSKKNFFLPSSEQHPLWSLIPKPYRGSHMRPHAPRPV
jgi:hypothetical protein